MIKWLIQITHHLYKNQTSIVRLLSNLGEPDGIGREGEGKNPPIELVIIQLVYFKLNLAETG